LNESEFVDFVIKKISAQFQVEKVILFGSRAKGTARPTSDFDILVIAKTDIPFFERQTVALRTLGKSEYPVDLLIYTESEAAQASAILGSAVYWAEKEGRICLA
jgi:uncharacterized protein